MTHDSRGYAQEQGYGMTAGLFALVGGALAAYGAYHLFASPARPVYRGDAPQTALRRGGAASRRETAAVGRTVTINRPRQQLYDFWRELTNLPRVMENVRQVDVQDDKRSHWVIAGPGGIDIEFDAIITEERPGELIAWQSDEGADIRNSGRIIFRDAPGGRGTEVDATISYDPPAGAVGQLIAKVFQREPRIQTRRDLKRFKQLMETGEIATTEPGPAAPRAA